MWFIGFQHFFYRLLHRPMGEACPKSWPVSLSLSAKGALTAGHRLLPSRVRNSAQTSWITTCRHACCCMALPLREIASYKTSLQDEFLPCGKQYLCFTACQTYDLLQSNELAPTWHSSSPSFHFRLRHSPSPFPDRDASCDCSPGVAEG